MKHPLVFSWFVATGLLTLGSILFVAFSVSTIGTTDTTGRIINLVPSIVGQMLRMIALCLVYANLAPRLQSKALAPVGFIHLGITLIASTAQFGALYYPLAAIQADGPDVILMQLLFNISAGIRLLQHTLFIVALIVALNAQLKPVDATFS